MANLMEHIKEVKQEGNGQMKRIELLIILLVLIAIGLLLFWLIGSDSGVGFIFSRFDI